MFGFFFKTMMLFLILHIFTFLVIVTKIIFKIYENWYRLFSSYQATTYSKGKKEYKIRESWTVNWHGMPHIYRLPVWNKKTQFKRNCILTTIFFVTSVMTVDIVVTEKTLRNAHPVRTRQLTIRTIRLLCKSYTGFKKKSNTTKVNLKKSKSIFFYAHERKNDYIYV